MLARIPMMAITISSSMSVKPDEFFRVKYFCMVIKIKKYISHVVSTAVFSKVYFPSFTYLFRTTFLPDLRTRWFSVVNFKR